MGGNHAHSDAALESSADGIRALKRSLAALGLTALLQAAVVVPTGSVALLGDTLHNVTDALTALPLWLAFSIGRRPANRRYTYGYGRAEDIAGVVILLAILASAVAAGYESIDRLLHPRDVKHLWAVFAAGVIGFMGNELVALYRIRVGRRIDSAALVADGMHARTDGLTSLGVVAGAVGVAAGWPQADPAVGLVITVAILFVLRTAARDVYRRLMDAVDPNIVDEAEHLLGHVDGVEGITEVRLRWVGHRLRAEARVVVDLRRSIVEAHEISEAAEHALLHGLPLADAIVHVDPCDHDGRDPHKATAHHPRS